ncbi:MAG: 4-hydroxyphenylpyruvate dioxygenase [Actinomycetia bacterium]|nr:4-hydroxyphenylpyruvate dioxygenase [Actinomycetes bacterium]
MDADLTLRAKEFASQDPFPMKGFGPAEWWVGNAFMTAQAFRALLGMQIVGYRGPETGVSDRSSYLLVSDQIQFIVTGAQDGDHEIAEHVKLHGPGVKDVGFLVPDAKAAFAMAVDNGALPERSPEVIENADGRMVIGAIHAYGDTVHSLIEIEGADPRFEIRTDTVARSAGLHAIDHVVANVELGKMNYWVEFYERIFAFTMLKHFDDDAISTEYTALMSKVMAGGSGVIKLPINEPAHGKKKSQIEEYLDFYKTPGVQHLALSTDDLQTTIADIHGRGIETIYVPSEYYPEARERLSDVELDWERIEQLSILVDQDDDGYLLQTFTKMLQDRPTVFFEFIERRGATGFGIGNFKALFESIEREQAKRGNL